MAQEFVIKSELIETKINQLLPSQGGFQPGVDFSASTMVIPIIDLTETAEGSSLRQDLQTSYSLGSVTSFDLNNTTSTLINNVGYFKVQGTFSTRDDTATGADFFGTLQFTDGTTTKILSKYFIFDSGTAQTTVYPFDFNVFIDAGESLTATTNSSFVICAGVTRQIADSAGNLVNP